MITLAAARSLNYLLYPALPVIIPDAVFHEATGGAGKLGAQEIRDWYRAHKRPRRERMESPDIHPHDAGVLPTTATTPAVSIHRLPRQPLRYPQPYPPKVQRFRCQLVQPHKRVRLNLHDGVRTADPVPTPRRAAHRWWCRSGPGRVPRRCAPPSWGS